MAFRNVVHSFLLISLSRSFSLHIVIIVFFVSFLSGGPALTGKGGENHCLV